MTHLMVTDCSIHPFEAPDLEDVHALIGDIYREYGMTLNLKDEVERHLLDPAAYFRAGGGEFWVVRDMNGTLIATAAVRFDPEDESTAELKSLYVRTVNRRRGFGRLLVTLAMRYARARGRRRFTLWSDTRLTAAHALYECMGFVQCGEREISDSNNSREYGFEIRLDPPPITGQDRQENDPARAPRELSQGPDRTPGIQGDDLHSRRME